MKYKTTNEMTSRITQQQIKREKELTYRLIIYIDFILKKK